jgi:hypothetical protein
MAVDIRRCLFTTKLTTNWKWTMMRAKWFFSPGIMVLTMMSTAALLAPYNASAQEKMTPPPNPDQRFQIERQANGFVRLDKKTGETSYCRMVIDSFVCTLAIEERDTLHNEITALQNKLAALQGKLDVARGDEPNQRRPKDDVPDPGIDDGAGLDQDKIEKEMDRAIEFTKHTMRKIFKAVKELQKEFEEDSPK